MSETTRLALPLILAAQAQKHVTHNDALAGLDVLVHLGLASRTILTPPPSPAEGEAYLLDGVASGSWAGQDGNIAAFINGDWQYFTPVAGWRAWVSDDQVLILFNGAVWQVLVGAGAVYDNLQSLGINTTADSTNRLSARTEAVLFSAIDVASGGIGDIQFKINKETATDTASLLLQTGFSGRAEMGLTGSDDWRIKVSADGTIWQDAIEVDAASGRPRFLQPAIFPSYTVAGLPRPALARRSLYPMKQVALFWPFPMAPPGAGSATARSCRDGARYRHQRVHGQPVQPPSAWDHCPQIYVNRYPPNSGFLSTQNNERVER